MTEPKATVLRAINGSPSGNLAKVLELAGGVERYVGPEDIVLVKPNLQWWNQGAPNLAALSRFVETIFDRPGGFRGEVVLAENCHRGPNPFDSGAAGWAHPFERNSDLPEVKNANDLVAVLKRKYGDRFTACAWIDAATGGRRVFSPKDGDGYVYCDGTGGIPLISCDNGAVGKARRTTIMTYPIFRTDRGTIVDFRNGVWEKGAYAGRPLRFVVFSALNHHSRYCGVTSAVKNYMGIVDLSGGPDPANGGRLVGEHHNFHSFPFDKWAPGPAQGALGVAIGTFIRTIRRADLHVTTAEWVGLASRVDAPVARTRAVLASADPVALDVHAAKYVLFPNSSVPVHDPDDAGRPLRRYLESAASAGAGILDEQCVEIRSYDLRKRAMQSGDDLAVVGEKVWGTDLKAIAKYLLMRFAA
ncbi:MAG: hypothetical protein M1550_04300 [Deltaproteobacteria bacterium]|nr:hypothetical protein [Deltaproteobacteria bacterium]